MISSIINRIQQIKCGEVPKCYYKTKAGIMPKDWLQNGEFMAKDIFRSVSDKKHDCHYQVLSATQDKGIVPRNEMDINIKYNKSNLIGYKKVNRGDFVISLRSFQGGIEYSSYEGLVSPAYTVLRANVPICEDYYKAYFKMDNFIKRLNNGTYGIRDGKQIGYEDFGNMIIHYPPIEEQKKIAEILTTQDKIIELKERKLAELKKLKKYYLSKMFPKRGSNYPEVRFPGFTEPWKQCKLGDCFSERNESMPDGELISVTINDGIKKFSELGRHDNSNEDKSKYKKVCIGDIAYNSMRMWQGASGYSPYEGIVSPAYTVLSPRSGIDSKCLSYQFKLTQMIHAFQVYSQGITSDTWNLKYPAFSQIDICISTDINEQKQIGKFFTQLDQLIALHQCELDEEKKLKKSLMQLLLTGIVRV